MIHIRLRGDLVETPGTPTDEFVFGLWGHRFHRVGNGTDWPNDVQTIAEKVRDAWVATVPTKSLYSSAVNLKSAQVYHMGTDNKTLDKGEATFDGDDTWNGTASGGLPWECATVVSLWGYTPGAFTQNKGRKRNRFYLPPMATSVMGTYNGKLTSAAQATITSEIGAFLNTVQGMEFDFEPNPAGNDYVQLVALSKGDTAPVGGAAPRPPSYTQVLTIGVGNVVDAQRRRRNKQIEAYSSADINS